MTTLIIRRFAQSIAFILLGSLVLYTMLVLLMPNGLKKTYDNIIESRSQYELSQYDSQLVEKRLNDLAQSYKLDQPWPLNYLLWLFDPNDTTDLNKDLQPMPKGIELQIGDLHIRGSGILTGNFGYSHFQGTGRGDPVIEVIGRGWVNTAVLVGVSLVISAVLALIIGIIGAVRQRSRLDETLTFFSFAGLSMPPFALGLILIIFLAIVPKQLHTQLGWDWLPYLPVGDATDSGQEGSWTNRLYHLALPAATLSLVQTVWLSRHIRFSMLDVLRQDYIRTARAKGVSTRRVVLKHALRNAMIPIITLMGLALPGLVTGAVVVEKVFNYNGTGELLYRSIGGCIPPEVDSYNLCPSIGGPIDHPTVLVLLLILLVIVALSNMVADILYAVADPRVNYNSRSRS